MSGPDAVAIATAIFRRSRPSWLRLQACRLRKPHVFLTLIGFTMDILSTRPEKVLFSTKCFSWPCGLRVAIRGKTWWKFIRIAAWQPCNPFWRWSCITVPGSQHPGSLPNAPFLNGRIDLAQAEAVVDIIQAKTKKSLEMAADQIRGGLSRRVSEISTALKNIMTDIDRRHRFP